jgi:hypothetical protein
MYTLLLTKRIGIGLAIFYSIFFTRSSGHLADSNDERAKKLRKKALSFLRPRLEIEMKIYFLFLTFGFSYLHLVCAHITDAGEKNRRKQK